MCDKPLLLKRLFKFYSTKDINFPATLAYASSKIILEQQVLTSMKTIEKYNFPILSVF